MASLVAAGVPVTWAPWPVLESPTDEPPEAALSVTVVAPLTGVGLIDIAKLAPPPAPPIPGLPAAPPVPVAPAVPPAPAAAAAPPAPPTPPVAEVAPPPPLDV